MIPNSLFTLRSIASTSINGVLFSDPSEFDVQALPGFSGLSHSPDFYVDNLMFALAPDATAEGSYEYRVELLDNAGNGWNIAAPFVVSTEAVPEPSSGIFILIALPVFAYGAARRRHFYDGHPIGADDGDITAKSLDLKRQAT